MIFHTLCPSTVAVSNSVVSSCRRHAPPRTATTPQHTYTTTSYYFYLYGSTRHPTQTKTNTDPALASTIPFRSGGDLSFTCGLVRHSSGIVGAIILFRATRERRYWFIMFGNIPNYDPSSGDGLPPNDDNNNQRVPPSADRTDQTLDDANRAALWVIVVTWLVCSEIRIASHNHNVFPRVIILLS